MCSSKRCLGCCIKFAQAVQKTLAGRGRVAALTTMHWNTRVRVIAPTATTQRNGGPRHGCSAPCAWGRDGQGIRHRALAIPRGARPGTPALRKSRA